MTTQPIPHIGATLSQRARLTSYVESMLSRTYRAEQRELEAERERLEKTTAALQVDALLDRIRENDASGCAECEDVPPPLWLVAVGSSLWTLLLVVGLVLTAVRCGWLK